jgi:hypothetical protein
MPSSKIMDVQISEVDRKLAPVSAELWHFYADRSSMDQQLLIRQFL